jgi:MOSC domain-containing protein YiiM
MSLATLQALAQEGWQTGPGKMGEQIVIDGIDVAALEPGARLRLGASAVIEVNFLRTPCEWLAQIQDKNHEDAIGRVGVMASVIASGDVWVGDAVAVLPAQVMR